MLKLGDAATKKKTTGRLYFMRKTNGTLETHYLDLGNVKSGGYKPDVQRAEHMKSDAGFKRVDLTLVKTVKPLFSFELDEITPDLERLRALSAAGSDTTQSAATATDEVLVTSGTVKGRTYFTTKQGISSLVVEVGVTAYTLGTDYVVDLGSGAITILPDSTIPNGSTLLATYNYATITYTSFTSFAELRVEGRFRFDEDDQFSTVGAPRAIHTWDGEAYISNWGENNGEDFQVTTLDSIPLTDPVVKIRKD